MPTRSSLVLTTFGMLACLPVANNYAQEGPQRKPGVSGIVRAADTGQPVQRAEVSIEGPALGRSRTVLTDVQGSYTFQDLPPGRYSVSAWKLGYVKSVESVTTDATERRLPTAAGTEQVQMTIVLTRAAVIVATVSSDMGEPVAGAFVTVLRELVSGGDRKLVPATGPAFIPTTDDLGTVRLYNLAPGKYYVAARLTALSRVADRRDVSAQVFFPGTLSQDQATAVMVSAGQELQITFPLVTDRLSRIRGVIVSSRGEPVESANLQLVNVVAGGITSHQIRRTGQGGFEATGLPPGTYLIEVRPAAESRVPEYARQEVHVTGDDIEGLVVTTTLPAAINGRLIVDGIAPKPGTNLDSVRIVPRFVGRTVAPGAVTKTGNGTFELRGILGRGSIRTQDPTNTWFLESIYEAERDITDAVLNFAELDGKTIDVRLTTRPTVLTGVTLDSKGVAPPRGTVIAFSEDDSRWSDTSRYIMTSRTDQAGKFLMRGLPPGTYLLAAVPSVEPGREFSAEFLAGLRPFATRVTLTPHGSHQLQIVLANPGG